MEEFNLFYQTKRAFIFSINTVSKPTSWYKKEQIRRPNYWDNEIFIADV